MSCKRKALDLADANAGPWSASTGKRSKAGGASRTDTWRHEITQRRRHRWSAVSGSKNLDVDLYEDLAKNADHMFSYTCICSPLDGRWEYMGRSGGCNEGASCVCGEQSTQLPGYRLIVTNAGLSRAHYAGDMFGLRDPVLLGVQTFDNHAADGAHEVVQNMMLDFDDAYEGKRWMEAWSIAEGLGLFLLVGLGRVMCEGNDEMRKVRTTVRQLTRIPLAILTAVAQAGLLDEAPGVAGRDNVGGSHMVRNAGFLISLWRRVSIQWHRTGMLDGAELVVDAAAADTVFEFEADYVDLYLSATARRYGIFSPTLTMDMSSNLSRSGETAMPMDTTHDAWSWSPSFGSYCRAHPGKVGGDALDMSTWSTEQRSRYSMSGRDPLPRGLSWKLRKGLRIETY